MNFAINPTPPVIKRKPILHTIMELDSACMASATGMRKRGPYVEDALFCVFFIPAAGTGRIPVVEAGPGSWYFIAKEPSRRLPVLERASGVCGCDAAR